MLSIGMYALCGFRVLEPSRERVGMNHRLLGESVSPFIGEGDGLTSERERE